MALGLARLTVHHLFPYHSVYVGGCAGDLDQEVRPALHLLGDRDLESNL